MTVSFSREFSTVGKCHITLNDVESKEEKSLCKPKEDSSFE